MGCDYYITIYLKIVYKDNNKKEFKRILNSDKRLYQDINNIISSYYSIEKCKFLTLSNKKGYIIDIPSGKTYNQILEEMINYEYIKKIYDYKIGWDLDFYLYDWSGKDIEYLKEKLKNIPKYGRSDIEYINISEDDLIKVWIGQYSSPK